MTDVMGIATLNPSCGLPIVGLKHAVGYPIWVMARATKVSQRLKKSLALSENRGGIFKRVSLRKEEGAGPPKEYGALYEPGYAKIEFGADKTASGTRPCRHAQLFRNLRRRAQDHGRTGFRAQPGGCR